MRRRLGGEAKVFPKQRRDDDCLRACLAGLLEIPMRVLPDPQARGDNERFWAAYFDWLEERGMTMVFHQGDVDPETDGPATRDLPQACRWIAAVPSLTMRGKKHVVLMENGELIHDPCRGQGRVQRPHKIFYGITVEWIEERIRA